MEFLNCVHFMYSLGLISEPKSENFHQVKHFFFWTEHQKLSNSNLLNTNGSQNGATKEEAHHHHHHNHYHQVGKLGSHYQIKDENTENAILCTALKLAYLHATDKITNEVYDFMFRSLSLNNSRLKSYFNDHHHNPYGGNMALNQNGQPKGTQDIDTSKILLKKYMVDYIDRQTVAKVKSSPLYSLVLQADVDFLAVYVYINYMDHTALKEAKETPVDYNPSENIEQRRLIKVINLKKWLAKGADGSSSDLTANVDTKYRQMQSGLSTQTKWSKFIIEQLKNTIVNTMALEKQDLMCVSLDIRLLEKICFPTFQLYLSDFFHTNILIIPSLMATKCLVSQLVDWKFDELNFEESFFKPLINFVKYVKHVNLNDLTFINMTLDQIEEFFAEKSLSDYFKGLDLINLIHILEFLYVNYSKIVSHLKKVTTATTADTGLGNPKYQTY